MSSHTSYKPSSRKSRGHCSKLSFLSLLLAVACVIIFTEEWQTFLRTRYIQVNSKDDALKTEVAITSTADEVVDEAVTAEVADAPADEVVDEVVVTNETNVTLLLPNVLLFGAQKAGTTATAEWLFRYMCRPTKLPNMPSFYEKEVHFFNSPARYKLGLSYYLDRYRHCADQTYRLDATPNSLNYAKRIYDTYHEHGMDRQLKLIVILREPIDRELALFNHMVYGRNHLEEGWNPGPVIMHPEEKRILTFDEYVNLRVLPQIKSGKCFGLYSHFLSQWFQYFDRQSILVLSYQELKRDSITFMRRIQSFLNLPDTITFEMPRENVKSYDSKLLHPTCTGQNALKDVFDTLNQRLYKLLESQPGPSMEQRPFPHFNLSSCQD